MAPKVDVVVLGASGHGMVVCDIVTAAGGDLRVIGFVDVNPALHGARVLNLPVVGTVEDMMRRGPVRVAMGIGDNAARRRAFAQILDLGLQPLTAIHPSAVVSLHATVGRGAVVMANATVNVAAEIGENVILNTSCSVDHHCVIGPHAHIAPGAVLAGNVRIGEETLVGAGAVVIPGISIGARCIVGASAVVTADVPDEVTVAGVPARPIARPSPSRGVPV
jgi:sugar O-acyltransferase (sialic acid O-acetyltransferase NeuD family)